MRRGGLDFFIIAKSNLESELSIQNCEASYLIKGKSRCLQSNHCCVLLAADIGDNASLLNWSRFCHCFDARVTLLSGGLSSDGFLSFAVQIFPGFFFVLSEFDWILGGFFKME